MISRDITENEYDDDGELLNRKTIGVIRVTDTGRMQIIVQKRIVFECNLDYLAHSLCFIGLYGGTQILPPHGKKIIETTDTSGKRTYELKDDENAV